MPPFKHLSGFRSTSSTAASRLGWLDALRGIAALSVAIYHLALPFYWVPHGTQIPKYADPGVFGVMLFFLVSGYIVPVSLERKGDVQSFWVGRVFRLYPVLIVTVAVSMLVLPRAFAVVNGNMHDHPVITTAANATMLQDLMGVPSAIGVMWTLSYEMVFYFLVTAVFAVGRQRQSGPLAVGFAAVALLLGGAIPSSMLVPDHAATRHLVLAVCVLVVLALGALLSGRQELTKIAAVLLGVLGLVLVFLNGRSAAFESMMIFATMFSGTLLYRAEHGQVSRVLAGFCCTFVILSGFLAGYMYNHGPTTSRTWTDTWKSFSFAYLAAWALFLCGMMLRKRRFPRILTWFGAVSYSIYLLHNPLIHAMDWLLAGHAPIHSWSGRAVQFTGFLAALLLVSFLAYRLVELPFQKLGRRALTALRQYLPPSRPASPELTPGAERDRTSQPVLTEQR